MSSLIIYTSDDGQTRINLRAETDSIWLSPAATIKESLTVAADGKGYGMTAATVKPKKTIKGKKI